MNTPKKGSLKSKTKGTQVIKGSRPDMGVFRTEITRTTAGGLVEPYKFKTTSIDTTGYSKGKPSFNVITKEGTGDKISTGKTTNVSKKKISRNKVPSILKSLQQNKKGGSIKSKKK